VAPPDPVSPPAEEIRGCRPAAAVFAVLLAFAAAAFGGGLALALSCTGLCGRAGVALYAAGGPVSGLFAAVAGELPVAWPLDLTVWIVVAAAVARRTAPWRGVAATVGAALAYGAVVAALVAPA